jgi:hypothetical protein
MMTDTARTSRIEEIEANNLELQRLYSEIEAMAAPPAPRFPWATALMAAAVGAVIGAGITMLVIGAG